MNPSSPSTATSTARERPILFKGDMIRALISDAKTQTRRVITPQPLEWSEGEPIAMLGACPYGRPGDRLWVRESWRVFYRDYYGKCTIEMPDRACQHLIDYAADEGCQVASIPIPWRPSIFMRRDHCRLILEITEVRVQRIQSISDQDIEAEGVVEFLRSNGLDPARTNHRAGWIDLWDRINAGRDGGAYAWERNPWVWAITFRRAEKGGAP